MLRAGNCRPHLGAGQVEHPKEQVPKLIDPTNIHICKNGSLLPGQGTTFKVSLVCSLVGVLAKSLDIPGRHIC